MSVVTRVRGFENLGNTCYMNAGLQVLLSSNIINTALMLYIKKSPKALEKFSPILIEYCKIIVDMIPKEEGQHAYRSYRPSSFKSVVGRENDFFGGSAQRDSHEFLSYIINEFADQKRDKGIANIFRKLCFGKYKQYLSCAECEEVTIKYFNFLDVILPIPDTKKVPKPDLESCFKKFAEYELLDDKNKWFCPKCKKHVRALRKMEIHEVPDLAIFTFNRFTGTEKNNTPIEIFKAIKLEEKKLKLIGILNHHGSTGGGHYVSHVLRGSDWYKANDSSITKVNIESLLNDPSVYITVYQVDC